MTIDELKQLKESEDKAEFKEAKHNFSFAGSEHREQEERRKCFLGYVVAFANEGGGMLVLGMTDKFPHQVVGSDFAGGKVGALEDETYSRLGIRVKMGELYENDNRVLVINIPTRPVGKLLKFEGVPLMRVGDSLRNMSDEEMFAILSEQEPDFSAKICKGLTIDDIDENAIDIIKEKYSKKQNNPGFKTQSDSQVLSDLDLMVGGKLTNAALILTGKKDRIHNLLPQTKVIIEYRRSETAIEFDNRVEIQEPLFVAIDKIWGYINQPASNPTFKLKQGPYIYDIPFFKEYIIREAVLNAIVHRDYTITSEIVIKQYPNKIVITNPGGFPRGVNLENLLTINSTPRSRLLADILLKTGLVERSGQGVDKLFLYSLMESKPVPDYSGTSMLQVELKISADIQDPSFLIFTNEEQGQRDENNKLSVFDLITLDKIRRGISSGLNTDIVQKLLAQNVIKRSGKTTSEIYTLGDKYFEITQTEDEIAGYRPIYLNMIAGGYQGGNKLSMSDFMKIFEDKLTRDQVRYMIEKLVNDDILFSEGKGKGTKYHLNISDSTGKNFFDLIKRKLTK
ncbi:MAG: AAA family ATPase [Bacteroidetes bacterium 4484_276]|nr:MAG: AAA family ATPase [Bacteroidetes bacterium 4484_276]OYT13036.1 MAG: AAA family ATPase [Bacteroidetes bacterium 4572_114]